MLLEDYHISEKIGMSLEKIAIIKELNKTAEIVVKTPVGNTEEFTVHHIVKQGTVLGPLLCSTSTAECCDEHTQGGVNIGSTQIRSLAYVDDILDVNEDEVDAMNAHNTVIDFTAKKRLEISWKKCAILTVNSTKARTPKLIVNEKPIKSERTVKYLGDFINDKGTNADLVEDRVKKGDGCAVNIFSIVQEVTFGCYTLEATLLLYNSVFLATMLYNSQSWSRLTNKDMSMLKGCQLSFLKRILHAPKSAPTAIVIGELGVLPLEFEIQSRKLMFLQHILKLDQTDPVKQVYYEQLTNSFEPNWANEVESIKRSMDLMIDDESIKEMSKSAWKERVSKAIKEGARKEVNKMNDRLKRVKRQYSELKTKDYLELTHRRCEDHLCI